MEMTIGRFGENWGHFCFLEKTEVSPIFRLPQLIFKIPGVNIIPLPEGKSWS